MTTLLILIMGIRDLENGIIEKNHFFALVLCGIILDGITILMTKLYLTL